MRTETTDTYWTRIYMAGDVSHAKIVLRKYLFENPGCVNISASDYIYTGGEETGFVVEYINYPKFPKCNTELLVEANVLANHLMAELGQRSCTVMNPEKSVRYIRKEYNE